MKILIDGGQIVYSIRNLKNLQIYMPEILKNSLTQLAKILNEM